MSWSEGESLLCETWEKVRDHVDGAEHYRVLAELIDLFEQSGMDCYNEIRDLEEGEEALRLLHPDWEHN